MSFTSECPACGAVVDADDRFCPKCGAMLEIEAVPPAYPITFNFLPDEAALDEIARNGDYK